MVTLSDTNLLSSPNEPSDNGMFGAVGLSSGPCGFIYPFEMAAYEGRYTTANIPSASKLEVFDLFGVFFCPRNTGASYQLGPKQGVTTRMNISGYWTSGCTYIQSPISGTEFSSGVHHPFAPGVYTLVVADAWGHTQILYFQVAWGSSE